MIGVKSSKTTVIGILGTSYSGSTLLNLVLGSHPEIYAGGELSAIIAKRSNPVKSEIVCTHCGEACPYWTMQLLQSIDFPDFYSVLARIFAKKIIVDSSKHVSWFDSAIRQSPDTNFVMIAIVKHPVRLFASFRINAFRRPELAHYNDIDTCLQSISAHYQSVLQRFQESGLIVVEYESLVSQLQFALEPVLKRADLMFHSQMNTPFDVVHHQIGGNAGPLYQARKKWDLDPENVHPVRRKRYEERRGIYIDNDYAEVLSRAEIERIVHDERVQALALALGVRWEMLEN